MGMPLARVDLAIFAKAPQPGYAKTRLIPALGAVAAARLQRELSVRAVMTARTAALGEVTLWCAPDVQHRFFRALQRRFDLACRAQSEGNLGQRMAHAFATHGQPLLMIGTDCPALAVAHLQQAAQALQSGSDAVFIPAEDGGYALVGLRRPLPELFIGIDWGTAQVMPQTRKRLRTAGLNWQELGTLWDVDRPEDVARWRTLQRELVA